MDSRYVVLACCLVLAGCLGAPQGSPAAPPGSPGNGSNVTAVPNTTAPQNATAPVQAPNTTQAQPDCTGNTEPTLSISYEVRGPDYLYILLHGSDADNDALVYTLNVTNTTGDTVGKISQNPDKSYVWTYTTGYAKFVVATATVSDMRGGQVCSTVTENQTIQAVLHNTEGNVTGA